MNIDNYYYLIKLNVEDIFWDWWNFYSTSGSQNGGKNRSV